MKVKTSVTLSPGLLAAIDHVAGKSCSRSEFIERVLQRYLRELRKAERNRRDAEIYARLASDPTFESDVLDYSIDPTLLGDDVELMSDPSRFSEAG